jgi:glutamate dehydrogenase
VAEVLLACYIADRSLEADRLRSALEAQPVSEALRLQAALRIEEAVREAAYSCLAPQRSRWNDNDEFAEWTEQVRALRALIDEGLEEASAATIQTSAEPLAEGPLDTGVVHEIDRLPGFARALGAVSLAMRWDAPLERVVQLHAAIGEATRISWLLQRLHDMDRDDDWDRLASDALHVEMLEAQRSLTGRLLTEPDGTDALSEFSAAHARGLEQIERTVQQIEAGERCGLAPLAVLSQQIRRLC